MAENPVCFVPATLFKLRQSACIDSRQDMRRNPVQELLLQAVKLLPLFLRHVIILVEIRAAYNAIRQDKRGISGLGRQTGCGKRDANCALAARIEQSNHAFIKRGIFLAARNMIYSADQKIDFGLSILCMLLR